MFDIIKTICDLQSTLLKVTSGNNLNCDELTKLEKDIELEFPKFLFNVLNYINDIVTSLINKIETSFNALTESVLKAKNINNKPENFLSGSKLILLLKDLYETIVDAFLELQFLETGMTLSLDNHKEDIKLSKSLIKRDINIRDFRFFKNVKELCPRTDLINDKSTKIYSCVSLEGIQFLYSQFRSFLEVRSFKSKSVIWNHQFLEDNHRTTFPQVQDLLASLRSMVMSIFKEESKKYNILKSLEGTRVGVKFMSEFEVNIKSLRVKFDSEEILLSYDVSSNKLMKNRKSPYFLTFNVVSVPANQFSPRINKPKTNSIATDTSISTGLTPTKVQSKVFNKNTQSLKKKKTEEEEVKAEAGEKENQDNSDLDLDGTEKDTEDDDEEEVIIDDDYDKIETVSSSNKKRKKLSKPSNSLPILSLNIDENIALLNLKEYSSDFVDDITKRFNFKALSRRVLALVKLKSKTNEKVNECDMDTVSQFLFLHFDTVKVKTSSLVAHITEITVALQDYYKVIAQRNQEIKLISYNKTLRRITYALIKQLFYKRCHKSVVSSPISVSSKTQTTGTTHSKHQSKQQDEVYNNNAIVFDETSENFKNLDGIFKQVMEDEAYFNELRLKSIFDILVFSDNADLRGNHLQHQFENVNGDGKAQEEIEKQFDEMKAVRVQDKIKKASKKEKRDSSNIDRVVTKLDSSFTETLNITSKNEDTSSSIELQKIDSKNEDTSSSIELQKIDSKNEDTSSSIELQKIDSKNEDTFSFTETQKIDSKNEDTSSSFETQKIDSKNEDTSSVETQKRDSNNGDPSSIYTDPISIEIDLATKRMKQLTCIQNLFAFITDNALRGKLAMGSAVILEFSSILDDTDLITLLKDCFSKEEIDKDYLVSILKNSSVKYKYFKTLNRSSDDIYNLTGGVDEESLSRSIFHIVRNFNNSFDRDLYKGCIEFEHDPIKYSEFWYQVNSMLQLVVNDINIKSNLFKILLQSIVVDNNSMQVEEESFSQKKGGLEIAGRSEVEILEKLLIDTVKTISNYVDSTNRTELEILPRDVMLIIETIKIFQNKSLPTLYFNLFSRLTSSPMTASDSFRYIHLTDSFNKNKGTNFFELILSSVKPESNVPSNTFEKTLYVNYEQLKASAEPSCNCLQLPPNSDSRTSYTVLVDPNSITQTKPRSNRSPNNNTFSKTQEISPTNVLHTSNNNNERSPSSKSRFVYEERYPNSRQKETGLLDSLIEELATVIVKHLSNDDTSQHKIRSLDNVVKPIRLSKDQNDSTITGVTASLITIQLGDSSLVKSNNPASNDAIIDFSTNRVLKNKPIVDLCHDDDCNDQPKPLTYASFYGSNCRKRLQFPANPQEMQMIVGAVRDMFTNDDIRQTVENQFNLFKSQITDLEDNSFPEEGIVFEWIPGGVYNRLSGGVIGGFPTANLKAIQMGINLSHGVMASQLYMNIVASLINLNSFMVGKMDVFCLTSDCATRVISEITTLECLTKDDFRLSTCKNEEWITKARFISCRLIIVPIFHTLHFFVIIIFKDEKKLYLLDSRRTHTEKRLKDRMINHILTYLNHILLGTQHYSTNIDKDWTIYFDGDDSSIPALTQQGATNDCHIYAVGYMLQSGFYHGGVQGLLDKFESGQYNEVFENLNYSNITYIKKFITSMVYDMSEASPVIQYSELSSAGLPIL